MSNLDTIQSSYPGCQSLRLNLTIHVYYQDSIVSGFAIAQWNEEVM